MALVVYDMRYNALAVAKIKPLEEVEYDVKRGKVLLRSNDVRPFYVAGRKVSYVLYSLYKQGLNPGGYLIFKKGRATFFVTELSWSPREAQSPYRAIDAFLG